MAATTRNHVPLWKKFLGTVGTFYILAVLISAIAPMVVGQIYIWTNNVVAWFDGLTPWTGKVVEFLATWVVLPVDRVLHHLWLALGLSLVWGIITRVVKKLS